MLFKNNKKVLNLKLFFNKSIFVRVITMSKIKMNESTRQQTTKSLRNGKKVNHANLEQLEPEPEKPKKRSWESWSYEDK